VQQRILGRTGRAVSVIGLGTWQLGSDWGEVSESEAMAVLQASVEAGVTFFDTADVYGDGRSESMIGKFLTANPGIDVTVGTKIGRRADQLPQNYNLANFRSWIDRSRTNLGVDVIDLVQLHCPPTPVYSDDAVFDALDQLVDEGMIKNYGVSVERTDEALTAIKRPGVATVQIIVNVFRQKPLDEVLPAAEAAGVGIIARVPLASGLLSGRYTAATTFPDTDHRTYNRSGAAFDVGETFSGVDFATGVAAAQEFTEEVAEFSAQPPFDELELTPAKAALAWIIQQPGVATVIPGARNAGQARANAAAADIPELGPLFEHGVRQTYDIYFRKALHDRW
jgi:aryl-alcohol dehydrogenase-like predicted oxidoreductase